MAALNPQRRTGTARELAARYGISERSVRDVIAEPRDDFEARARARQMQALGLREQGMTYQAIADQMGISRGAAAGLVHRAKDKSKEDAAA